MCAIISVDTRRRLALRHSAIHSAYSQNLAFFFSLDTVPARRGSWEFIWELAKHRTLGAGQRSALRQGFSNFGTELSKRRARG